MRSRPSALRDFTVDRRVWLLTGVVARQAALFPKFVREHALEAQQQTVGPETWRVNHLLVNQHGIDHATILDQLLPVPTVPRKTGDFACRNRADLPQTDFSDHALKSGTRH